VAQFLDDLASERATPGGGAAAAVAAGLGAGLVAMVARYSIDRVPDASMIAARADDLRHSSLALASQDAQAYNAVLEARGTRSRALSAAADPPLAIAEAAAELAEFAGRLAHSGNPNLKGDALTGAILAEGAARAAAALVEINLQAGGVSDDRLERANAARTKAAAALWESRPGEKGP
jgi:methenyltetrahydrofolate cyclohydrolase